MIQLFLLLCGTEAVRRKWAVILAVGLLWFAGGAYLFFDALVHELRISPAYFTIPLVLDGVWTLLGALSARGVGMRLRMTKAGMIFCVVLLILFAPKHSGMIIGILVGSFMIAASLWRGASAWVVHFPGWSTALVYAVFEFIWGVWALVPWPTYWEGEVGADVGTLFMFTAVEVCILGLRIRRLPPGVSILAVLRRARPDAGVPAPADWTAAPAPQSRSGGETVIVHVWTPTEGLAPIRRGISRYIAALNKKGVVSTGHAALEIPPDLYISHYPGVEIDRSGAEFARTLRATEENDIAGIFQPGYAEESAEWCPSTMRVELPGLNVWAIRAFWESYRADSTYNLTNRNCSSAVAAALDAGMEGIFSRRNARNTFPLLRLLFSPEFWVAGFMRHRAYAMAWTPGIMLDYARALSFILALPERRGKGTRPAPGAAGKTAPR